MTSHVRSAFVHAPLFFEPVPPSARLSPASADRQFEAVARVVEQIPRIDAINVPELLDENHDGRPYYRTSDPRLYTRRIAERTGRLGIVNKVVAHLTDAEHVRRWAEETTGLGVRHAVLIGGNSRFIPYPGPPVIEANRICEPVFARAGGGIGNVAIPQRMGEADRMLAKTKAGCTFFTTQILYDAEPALATLVAYGERCAAEAIAPAPVLLSLAPLADEADVEFVRWLGAEVPLAVEDAVLAAAEWGGTAGAEASTSRAVQVYEQIRRGVAARAPQLLLGVNVEQISARHLPLVVPILEAIARALAAPAHVPSAVG